MTYRVDQRLVPGALSAVEGADIVIHKHRGILDTQAGSKSDTVSFLPLDPGPQTSTILRNPQIHRYV
ncbi:hypothetical protein GCM10028800_06370 [Nesterenkonia populi]